MRLALAHFQKYWLLRVIFDQWPKLHLDLDSLSNQRILKGVYSLWPNGGNKANWRNIKAKLKKKYFVSFLLYFIIPSGFMSFLPAFVDKSRSSGSETWSSEDGSWSSGSGTWSSECRSMSSGRGTWNSEDESWNSESGSWGTFSPENGSLDSWGSGNDGNWVAGIRNFYTLWGHMDQCEMPEEEKFWKMQYLSTNPKEMYENLWNLYPDNPMVNKITSI